MVVLGAIENKTRPTKPSVIRLALEGVVGSVPQTHHALFFFDVVVQHWFMREVRLHFDHIIGACDGGLHPQSDAENEQGRVGWVAMNA